MKKSLITSTVLSAAMLASMGTVFAAPISTTPASHPVITQVESTNSSLEQELRDRFVAARVPQEKIEPLIAKVLSGQQLDEETPGVQPAEVKKYENGGYYTEETRFPDGSFQILRYETGKKSDRSIYGCSNRTDSFTITKNTCIVEGKTTLVSASFRASYIITKRGGATIKNISDAKVSTLAGTTRNTSLTITRSHATGSAPAEARLKFTFDAVLGIGSRTNALYLRVSYRGSESSEFKKGV